ncbi:MAG: LemA family protein [Nanobdellota archaeon]
MGIGMTIVIGVAVLLVVAIFFGYFIGIYNGFVRLKNDMKKAWANIDVLLKQRTDELPKLLSTVKGYMKHEKGVLTEVTRQRTAVMNAQGVKEKAAASDGLTNALKSLFAVAENYPDLKANQNFMHLQDRISGLENEIADRREYYNDAVNTFNIRIAQFPHVLIARLMALTEQDMFKVSAADRQDVEIKF